MHKLAGVITTPTSAPLHKRMSKFCDYYGNGRKGKAFCDGWGVACIDKKGILHTSLPEGVTGLETYCPPLSHYVVRNILNPYYGIIPEAKEEYYPADLSLLITHSDIVYQEEEVEEKLARICEKHPGWGIYVIQYHEL